MAVLIILFISFICVGTFQANVTHAFPQQQSSFLSKPIVVKIMFPAKGQLVALGKNLTISGISKYNTTSNCQVFVILDGIRPYQKTFPLGQNGTNDYSKWKYTLVPTYVATINQGTNKITAKLSCQASPVNVTKFYSVNVTGANVTIPNQQHLAIASNNTNIPFMFPASSISSNNGDRIKSSLIAPLPVSTTDNNTAAVFPLAGNSKVHSDNTNINIHNNNNHRPSSGSGDHTSSKHKHGSSGSNSNGNTNSNDNNHHNSSTVKNDLSHKIITQVNKAFGALHRPIALS